MIPADLAARLRLLNEASFFNADQPVAGLQRAREIQADLPNLVPGQRVLATLQRPLTDGTFQAVVAGRQMTLALNTEASAGDTLDLIVTGTTPRAVFARLAAPDTAPAANASALPSLSRTGRLISFLLTGQPAPQPASLGAGKPLLDAPPASGAQLAPMLREALSQSGMFYESHQMQWAMGKHDTAALLREPHNQGVAGSGAAAREPDVARPPGSVVAERPAGASRPEEGSASPRSVPIPDRILPVVHQQLDALATHQYVWHGQAWPGQEIEWIIEDPESEGGGGADSEADEAEPAWNTTLRLTLPRLGSVDAQLHLTAAGVALRMRADDPDAIALLNRHGAELESALEAANLPLTGMVVEQR